MRYLLDTNICIFLINQHSKIVYENFQRVPVGNIAVSSITTSELGYGVEKSRNRLQNTQALQKFLLPLTIMPYDHEASQYYGRLRAQLEQKGKTIGPMDTMIAAHALSLGYTVVTNNTKEFRRVSGLQLEDWTKKQYT